jgi:hypothetical protein
LSENRCCIEQVFGDGDCSTVSFKLSPDLINWSESTVIRKCICKGGEWEIYPSLMDPRSPSDSFDTVGKTASLFHVNLHGRQIWSYDLEFGGVEGAEGDWLEQGSEIGQLTTDDDLKERLGPLKTDDANVSSSTSQAGAQIQLAQLARQPRKFLQTACNRIGGSHFEQVGDELLLAKFDVVVTNDVNYKDICR